MFTQTLVGGNVSSLTGFVGSYSYGYNGKEKENEISEGDLDFGARIYDGKIGRWLSCDPLSEKYPSLSSYNFCAGNPILFVDPDGMRIKLKGTDDEKNTFIGVANKNCTNVVVSLGKGGIMVVTQKTKPVLLEDGSVKINDKGEVVTEPVGNLSPYDQALLDSYENGTINTIKLDAEASFDVKKDKTEKSEQQVNILTLKKLDAQSGKIEKGLAAFIVIDAVLEAENVEAGKQKTVRSSVIEKYYNIGNHKFGDMKLIENPLIKGYLPTVSIKNSDKNTSESEIKFPLKDGCNSVKSPSLIYNTSGNSSVKKTEPLKTK